MANRSGSQTDQIQDDHNTILEAELLIILLWNYTDLSPLYTYIYIYIYMSLIIGLSSPCYNVMDHMPVIWILSNMAARLILSCPHHRYVAVI